MATTDEPTITLVLRWELDEGDYRDAIGVDVAARLRALASGFGYYVERCEVLPDTEGGDG